MANRCAVPIGSRLAQARNNQKALHFVYVPGGSVPGSVSSYQDRKRMIESSAAVAFYERARDAVGGTPIFHLPLSARGLVRPFYRLGKQIGYDCM